MAKTRDELLDAALTALNGRPSATMDEIATAIGSSRATLHRHFTSRDTLLTEIGARAIDRWQHTQDEAGIDSAAGSGDAGRIDAALRALLRQYALDAGDFGIVLTAELEATAPELNARALALVEREVVFIQAAQAAGILRADLPARWIGDVVFGLMVSARDSLRWGNVARRDLADLVERTFFSGVGR